MKKKISVLSASILIATSAKASITSGSLTQDSSAILVLAGDQGRYVYDTTLSAGDIANGVAFSLDISNGLAAIGSFSGYTLLGTLGCDNVNCVGGLGYSDAGLGFVYSGSPKTFSAGEGHDIWQAINQNIDSISESGLLPPIGILFGIIDPDPQSNPITLLDAYVEPAEDGEISFSAETSLSNSYGGSSVSQYTNVGIENGFFLACNSSGACPVVNEVPVPAAAWLFGSALIGLLVSSRNRR